ncbi:class I SAM-dependent methyltransferase [Candidatus Woesearchaeota archaeon]|nr:class I SAM-dependent methyltransferase [Candidatus Woesearchaeota archaeon]
MEQIKKGNANYNIKTNIAFIKATGLKKLSLLDVGCGTGRYAKIFEMLLPSYEIDYTGIDYSKEHIKIAKKTYKVGNAKFRVANQESLPFKNKSFDVATSFSVLPYAPHYEKAIAELRRVARKYVLITSISVTKGEEQILKQQAYGAEWSCTLFSEKKLKEVIKKNKLKIIKDVTLKDGGERIEKSYMLKVMK